MRIIRNPFMFDDVYMNDVAKVWRRKGLDENVKRRWMAKSEMCEYMCLLVKKF